MQSIDPVRPVAPWVGGKRNLAQRLVERIAAVPHTIYAEPFLGMGGVFFRRRSRPAKEAVNDINEDVVLLFRWLQRHYQQVLDALRWQICSRADFDRLVGLDVTRLTELERVARFLFLQRAAFGGKVRGQHYGVSLAGGARFDLTKLVPMLEDVHERLCGVDIERLPYADFIRRYDSPGTLFYLDPPYWDSEADYGVGLFSKEDFGKIRTLLQNARGRFLLSINDTPEIRKIFNGMAIEEVQTTYRLSGKVTPARELIISRPD